MNTDISYSPPTHGVVYGLIASDEPELIRYVGQTITLPVVRLASHLSKSGLRAKHGRWMQEVMARGAEVRLRVLARHPISELNTAERSWIACWRTRGCLLNG